MGPADLARLSAGLAAAVDVIRPYLPQPHPVTQAFARAVAAVAASAGDEASARSWTTLATWYLGIEVVASLLVLAALLGGLVVLAIAGFVGGAAALLWLTVRCFVDASRPWALSR